MVGLQTLNKKGAISLQLDPISTAFVERAVLRDAKVLEIGAGYGLACLEALKQGAENYTANELDERHLKILARRVKELNEEYLSRICLISGSFPTEIRMNGKSFDAILIARVLHLRKYTLHSMKHYVY